MSAGEDARATAGLETGATKAAAFVLDGKSELRAAVSHLSDKNKSVAKVGHPLTATRVAMHAMVRHSAAFKP
jgi:hypothetical protein